MEGRAPSLSKWLAEPLCLPKLAIGPFRRPVMSSEIGEGRPVLVLPGMASGDQSTALLRKSLLAAGYSPRPGRLGRNLTISSEKFSGLERLLADAVEEEGRRAVLLGWSLGGFYARVLAQRHPDLVAMVATLATPFSGNRRSNNAWRFYELLANHGVDDPPLPDDPSVKPPAYTIAFWSPIDGIVAPESARGLETERDEAVELPFRHFEMGCSRRAVATVLDVLNDRIARLQPT